MRIGYLLSMPATVAPLSAGVFTNRFSPLIQNLFSPGFNIPFSCVNGTWAGLID